MKPRIAALFFIVLSTLGFLDATYLTVEHYRGIVPPCSIVVGCATVTTSSYSLIFNIPVALLGSLYYLTILLLSVAYLDSKKEPILRLAAGLTVCGFLASAWFVFVQWQVIKAWCLYCIGSATSSTLLFILGMAYLKKHPRTLWEKIRGFLHF